MKKKSYKTQIADPEDVQYLKNLPRRPPRRWDVIAQVISSIGVIVSLSIAIVNQLDQKAREEPNVILATSEWQPSQKPGSNYGLSMEFKNVGILPAYDFQTAVFHLKGAIPIGIKGNMELKMVSSGWLFYPDSPQYIKNYYQLEKGSPGEYIIVFYRYKKTSKGPWVLRRQYYRFDGMYENGTFELPHSITEDEAEALNAYMSDIAAQYR